MEAGSAGSRDKRAFHITRDFPTIFENCLDPLMHILALFYLLATQTGLISTNPSKTMILQAVFVYVEWVLIYFLFLIDLNKGKQNYITKWMPFN
jgi:hypothetical protein